MADTEMTNSRTASGEGTGREVATLRHRAESLRHQADALDEVLALAYRRRASELEMEAWIHEVQAGVPSDEVLAVH